MEAPDDAVRQSLRDLDPAWPGAKLRIATHEKVADILDLWWLEVGAINLRSDLSPDDLEDLQATARTTMVKCLSLLLTGSIAFHDDEDAISDTTITLAILVAACESQLGVDMLPMREVVDAVFEADEIDDPSPT